MHLTAPTVPNIGRLADYATYAMSLHQQLAATPQSPGSRCDTQPWVLRLEASCPWSNADQKAPISGIDPETASSILGHGLSHDSRRDPVSDEQRPGYL
ncbi:hypothetical protein MRS44_010199 [Fusarium solani]|uniref:uncharacterized protein n=1 Tax=Fusarium solani TaxID=169388 RepID=UPI0032C499FD|nr:hypothetical protein MRS44_010199 [Fusarium solani]